MHRRKKHGPILVTGVDRMGAVRRTVTKLLLKQGKAVRAMVRNEDERAQALPDIGAEVVIGNMLDLDSTDKMMPAADRPAFNRRGVICRNHRYKNYLRLLSYLIFRF
jgi:hypothetical protein